MADTAQDPLATMVAGVHWPFIAPLGTPIPTDVGLTPGAGLDAAFVGLGYTADTGAAFGVDTATTDLFASQSLDPIRTIVQTSKATITLPLIQWSGPVLLAAFGGGTITNTSNGSKFVPPAAGQLDEVCMCLDIVDGDEMTRIFIERGLVAGSVSATLTKTAFASLPIVFNALAPITLPSSWFLIGTNAALAESGS